MVSLKEHTLAPLTLSASNLCETVLWGGRATGWALKWACWGSGFWDYSENTLTTLTGGFPLLHKMPDT